MTTDLSLATWWQRPRMNPDGSVPELYRPEHAGLYLDRCLPRPQGKTDDDNSKPERRVLHESAIAALGPNGYVKMAYATRHTALQRRLREAGPLRAVRALTLEATGRTLLHPGSNTTVTEGAALLHHTYGVPYLPGSGLKGIARAGLPEAARTRLAKKRSLRCQIEVEPEGLGFRITGVTPL